MARLPRLCPKGIPQHIIQRGNNRQVCFADNQDYATYANWLKQYSTDSSVDIHAWVFMSNHVHLLATPLKDGAISSLMQALGRRYVHYFNTRYQRSGTLWEGRFRSCLVQSEQYLLQCYRYIEMNPVRANMVAAPSQYRWSSYPCNALGLESDLCSPHREYLRLGSNDEERRGAYRELFVLQPAKDEVEDIRNAVNHNLALGNDRFKSQIETLYGRRVRPARMGRPRRISDVDTAVR